MRSGTNRETENGAISRRRLLVGISGGLVLGVAPAARAQAKLTYVDLQPKGNHRLSADLHETQGNHLGDLSQGELKFEDVKFNIGEQMIHVRGKNTPGIAEKVEGIAVGAAFDRLHLLHSCGYGEAPPVPDGTEIGHYTVHYADKTTERIPILYGEDLRDWWDWPERTEVKRARVAWTGTSPAAAANQRKVRLFATTWTNPHPGKQVTQIDLATADSDCDPFVVALTLEKK